ARGGAGWAGGAGSTSAVTAWAVTTVTPLPTWDPDGGLGFLMKSASTAAISAIEAKRSGICLAMALRMMASRRGSRLGRWAEGGVGCWMRVLASTAAVVPVNGSWQVSSSY